MCPPLSRYKALFRPSSKIKSWYRPALASYDAPEQIPEPASLSAERSGTPFRWAWRGHGPARAHTPSGHPCFRLWGGAVGRLTGVGGGPPEKQGLGLGAAKGCEGFLVVRQPRQPRVRPEGPPGHPLGAAPGQSFPAAATRGHSHARALTPSARSPGLASRVRSPEQSLAAW